MTNTTFAHHPKSDRVPVAVVSTIFTPEDDCPDFANICITVGDHEIKHMVTKSQINDLRMDLVEGLVATLNKAQKRELMSAMVLAIAE